MTVWAAIARRGQNGSTTEVIGVRRTAPAPVLGAGSGPETIADDTAIQRLMTPGSPGASTPRASRRQASRRPQIRALPARQGLPPAQRSPRSELPADPSECRPLL